MALVVYHGASLAGKCREIRKARRGASEKKQETAENAG
jgi:hypothetical protein